MREERIKEFYKKISDILEGEYKIILEEPRDIQEKWIEYDTIKWELEGGLIELVEKLKENSILSFEEKILKIYEYICLNYIYDDNVLYFFKKDNTDPNDIKYIAVDWYGRIPSKKWIENRKNHNRRICYEFSRFYAKAINILIEDRNNMEACMLGDIDNLHYVTVLIGEEYSLILDLDDFNSIKDLTRLKLGLTLEGIKIIEDKSFKFTNVLKKFNNNKPRELSEIENTKKNHLNKIEYLCKITEILNKWKLDSQGFCEYARALIENEGFKVSKLWKQVENTEEKRYARCLSFEFNNNTYLLDSVDQTLQKIEIEKLDKNIFILDDEKIDYPYFGG